VIAASTGAIETDYLLAAMVTISALILLLVFGLLFVFSWRYRASNPLHRGHLPEKSWRIEMGWTIATVFAFFALDVWAADLYLRDIKAPQDALKIYVTAKQWMWKAEQPTGQKEIDAVHVPLGRDIELILTSEDVIHDFSVPAFRLKQDVIPGRYMSTWFHPTKIGNYRLYCDQFCGTDHSLMTGEVVVMSKADYQNWLGRNGEENGYVAEGHRLFIQYGCSGCHQSTEGGGGGTVRAPPLIGVYGSPVPLSDGTTVVADDKYIRDSILQPDRQVVASYPPVMPSFDGRMSEGDLVRIIAYVKSMGGSRPVGTMTGAEHPLTGAPPYADGPTESPQ